MFKGMGLVLVLAWVAVMSTQVSAQTPAAGNEPLARVAKRVISTEQLNQAWQRKYSNTNMGGDQTQQVDAVLDELIQFELLFAGAKQAGYEQKPEVLQAIRRLIVDEYMKDTLLPELAAIAVDDDEIEHYYEVHTERFTRPAAIRGALIQITLPATVSTEKKSELRDRAQAALIEAQQLAPPVASFGSVAVKYSDDQATRYQGGDIGWISDNSRWGKQLTSAFQLLSTPGDISEVLETEAGFYLLKLMELKPGGVQPLAEVRQQIVHQLFRDKRKATRDRFFTPLRNGFDVEIYTDRVDAWIEQAQSRTELPPRQPAQ